MENLLSLKKRDKRFASMKGRRILSNTIIYIVLIVLCVIWVLPIVGILYTALRNERGISGTLVPADGFTFDNFARLFTDASFTSLYPFVKYLTNTLIVALCVMIISTIFVLSVAYTMSRLRFKARRPMMNVALIMGMFPGFMSMVATYNILRTINLNGQLIALILVYSGGAGAGYLIAKGFFDTISRSLDEAARIDGCNNFKIFYKIICPLSKPIIVYQLLTSFMGPWGDYIFASLILGANTDAYTVPVGLYNMISAVDTLAKNYTTFFAGATIIAIPIMVLFLITQKYYVSGVTGGAVKG